MWGFAISVVCACQTYTALLTPACICAQGIAEFLAPLCPSLVCFNEVCLSAHLVRPRLPVRAHPALTRRWTRTRTRRRSRTLALVLACIQSFLGTCAGGTATRFCPSSPFFRSPSIICGVCFALVCVCVCVCVCMCVCVCVFVCVCVCVLRMYVCMHACHACMHACMHVFMYVCTNVYMHTCIHAYIHACMYVWVDGWLHGRMDGWIHTHSHTR